MFLVFIKNRYLDGNLIQVVEGLESLPELEELHISFQKLDDDKHMVFCEKSMLAVQSSLKVLNAANNKIVEINPLKYLQGLRKLNLSNNQIETIEVCFYIISHSI